MRTRAGYFMSQKIIFNKPAISIEDQINLLKRRNLSIDNIDETKHYLTTIGYYRLMIYFRPFLMESNVSDNGFKPNTRFSDILNLYIFDRELRLLISDPI